jgi:hypothetical protein
MPLDAARSRSMPTIVTLSPGRFVVCQILSNSWIYKKCGPHGLRLIGFASPITKGLLMLVRVNL